MAYAGAHQRQQGEQSRGDHQRHQHPAGPAGLEAAGVAQAQRVEQGRQHGELAHKARQRGQAGDHQGGQHEAQADEGGRCGNGAADQHLFGFVEVEALRGQQFGVEEGSLVILIGLARIVIHAPAVHHVGDQKQGAHGQGGAGQVVQQPRRQGVLAKARGGQQGARRENGRKACDMRQALRAQHAQAAEGHGQHAADDQPGAAEQGGGAGLGAEQQRPQPQHHVDAHLGHEREHGAHGSGGCAVGRHQPEVQRPHGCLGQEGNAQDGSGRMQQPAVVAADLGDGTCQVGHVQRAGQAVEHGHADQEQRRGCKIDGDVVQARLDARPPGTMQDQSIGGREHDLEEHEQVEQVRREEGAAQAHQLKLEQRVKVHPRAVPAGAGEDQRGQGHGIGQHQHHAGQAVQCQRDAEGHGPVARHVDAQVDGRAGLVGPQHQHHGHAQPHQGGYQSKSEFEALALFAQQQHQRCRKHGQHDGRQHQVRHETGGQLVHGISCSVREWAPSTWSVPVVPREASSTTRNSAVMAKPITMAVSTSACGMGSA